MATKTVESDFEPVDVTWKDQPRICYLCSKEAKGSLLTCERHTVSVRNLV